MGRVNELCASFTGGLDFVAVISMAPFASLSKALQGSDYDAGMPGLIEHIFISVLHEHRGVWQPVGRRAQRRPPVSSPDSSQSVIFQLICLLV